MDSSEREDLSNVTRDSGGRRHFSLGVEHSKRIQELLILHDSMRAMAARNSNRNLVPKPSFVYDEPWA